MGMDEVLELTNEAEKVDTLSTEEKEDNGGLEATEFTEGKSDVKEESEAKFTQEELNDIVKDRLSRQERKIRDEYEQKYGRMEMVLNAGLQTSDIDEATQKLEDFYKKQGVVIPERRLTEREEQILANAEAEDIISDGYEAIVRRASAMASKGADNMTAKEKLVFSRLDAERRRQESIQELARIGVGKELLEDKEFAEFSDKLNPKLSMKEKYEMYERMKPKKRIETMGSMRGNFSKDDGVKEFYSVEEARRFTKEDFDRNPALFRAVERSMAKWGK